MSETAWFKAYAEKIRSNLRGSRTSTDLLVNEEKGVAVIGTQYSGGGRGDDSIYVLKVKDWAKQETSLVEVLNRKFESGRMFPTGISADGRSFTYRIKSDWGIISNESFSIDQGG